MNQQYYRKMLKKESNICEVADYIYNKNLKENQCEEMVGAFLVAPATYGFVTWLLQEAERKEIKRLYFLARDGYLMYKCALVICKALQLPIECKYLYCSRYSIRVPLFHLDKEVALDYICSSGIDVTLNKIMKRAGLSSEEADKMVQLLGRGMDGSKPLSVNEINKYRRELKQSSEFMEKLMEISKYRYTNTIGYLRQEGMFDSIKYAIVDSGWTGTMQKTLTSLLQSAGGKPRMEGFYWGLYEIPSGAKEESYHSYYFSPQRGIREKVWFNNNLFECIFSAPHGMTVSYQYYQGRYSPCFDRLDGSNADMILRQERSTVMFAEMMTFRDNPIKHMDSKYYRKMIRSMMRRFMITPSKAEVEEYGNLLFSDDVLQDKQQMLAVPLTKRELRDSFLLSKILYKLGLRKRSLKESAWYEGSVGRYGKARRYYLTQYAFCKYVRYTKMAVRKRK